MTGTAMTETLAARAALAAAAERSAQLIGSLARDFPVKGTQWTVGDTAAHLVVALRGFTQSASGAYQEWDRWADRVPDARMPERVQALNRATIAEEPEMDPAASARAVTDGVDGFLATTAGLSPDHVVLTPWYGEHDSLTVAQATCLLLGEQIMHGHDVAKAAGRQWPISSADALLIFEAVKAMLPKIALPDRIGTLRATYEFRLGRSSRFVVRVADQAISVEPVAGQHIDCHVLADPVALLLLGYGRSNQWQAIGRAKMITWGLKPWLAFRFPGLLANP